jgi:5-dehydro-4-deoxyglucarate dehydratase
MAQPNIELDGLLAFPLTPFTEDLELNLDAYGETVEAHVAAGAGALFIACGTGEFSSLSGEEQAALLRKAREVVAGRIPVWVGAGGGAATARAGVAAAQAGGADGVLLLPPYLVSGPPSGLVDHVRYAIGESTIPVIVYHRSNGAFTPSSAVELLAIPSVVGLKDGVGDVELMTRVYAGLGDRLTYIGGLPTAETFALPYLEMGVTTYSSAIFNFVPRFALDFFADVRAGDRAAVYRRLNEFVLPYLDIRDRRKGYAVSIIKAGLTAVGRAGGLVRPPLTDLTAEEMAALTALVQRVAVPAVQA